MTFLLLHTPLLSFLSLSEELAHTFLYFFMKLFRTTKHDVKFIIIISDWKECLKCQVIKKGLKVIKFTLRVCENQLFERVM